MMKRFIILDRDGVLNEDSKDYIKAPDEWRPIPRSLEAVKLLNEKGYEVVVATNQSGLARNYYDEKTLEAIHQKMRDALHEKGAHLAGIFYCPHGPEDSCLCRKPKPGLLHQIQEAFQISLAQTPFVGDSRRDLDAAITAGAKPILVRTGNGSKTLEKEPSLAAEIPVFEDLYAFALSL